MAHYVRLEQVDSTNTYLQKVAHDLPGGTVVYTPNQTAGRGQRGNRWLAQPGMNITMSYLFKPTRILAREQFGISEAVSLAVSQVLTELSGECITIKWPNDIYHCDKKICGMLIENSLDGQQVAHSVIGIGINVNQMAFDPYAPNPTSLALITGCPHDVDEAMRSVCLRLEQQLDTINNLGANSLHTQYLQSLYRYDSQPHAFELPDGTQFAATMVGVAPDGMLSLRHESDGITRDYAFKQVAFVM